MLVYQEFRYILKNWHVIFIDYGKQFIMQTKKLLLMAICFSTLAVFAKPPQGNMPEKEKPANCQNKKGCSGQAKKDAYHHGGHHKKKGEFHGQYNGNSQNHQYGKQHDDKNEGMYNKNKGQNFK